MREQQNRIEGWLRRLALQDPPVAKVVIRHQKATGRAATLGTYKFEQDPAELAGLVILDLEQDAENYSGRQLYTLSAYVAEETKDEPIGRVTVKLAGGQAEDDEDGPTEGADARGLAAQAMRHTEAMTRIFAGALGDIFGTQGAIIERQQARLMMFERDHVETLELKREALLGEAEREEDRERARRGEERKEQLTALVMGEILPRALPHLGDTVERMFAPAPKPKRRKRRASRALAAVPLKREEG